MTAAWKLKEARRLVNAQRIKGEETRLNFSLTGTISFEERALVDDFGLLLDELADTLAHAVEEKRLQLSLLLAARTSKDYETAKRLEASRLNDSPQLDGLIPTMRESAIVAKRSGQI